MIVCAPPWLLLATLFATHREVFSRAAATTTNITTTATASSIFPNITRTPSTIPEYVTTVTSTTTMLIPTSVPNAGIAKHFWGEIKIAVNDASSFVREANLKQVLRQSLATLGSVPVAWVQILQIKLGGAEMRMVPRQRRLDASLDVDISWKIEVPAGSKLNITTIAEEIKRKTLAETSLVMSTFVKSGALKGSYEVEVTWKFVHWKTSSTTLVPQSSHSQPDRVWSKEILIVLIGLAFLGSTALLAYLRIDLCKYHDPMSQVRLPKKPRSLNNFAKVGGPLAQQSYMDLMEPPIQILQKEADEARQLARAMVPSTGWRADVFLTFAARQRSTDAASCGPEMFYALGLLRFLHDNNVECFSELMLSKSNDSINFCQLLEQSPCKVLIVLQTKALYDSIAALEQIYTAQNKHIELFPLRFEADLPKLHDEWANVPCGDLTQNLWLQNVQSKFSQLNSTPSPPYTVQSQPEILKDVVVDLKLKLGLQADQVMGDEMVRRESSGLNMVPVDHIQEPVVQRKSGVSSMPFPVFQHAESETFQPSMPNPVFRHAGSETFHLRSTSDTQEAITDSTGFDLETCLRDKDLATAPRCTSGNDKSTCDSSKSGTRQKKLRNSTIRSAKRLLSDGSQSDMIARRRTKKPVMEEASPKESALKAKMLTTSHDVNLGRTKPMRLTTNERIPNTIGFPAEASQSQSLTRKRPKRHTTNACMKGSSHGEAIPLRVRGETV